MELKIPRLPFEFYGIYNAILQLKLKSTTNRISCSRDGTYRVQTNRVSCGNTAGCRVQTERIIISQLDSHSACAENYRLKCALSLSKELYLNSELRLVRGKNLPEISNQ